MNLLDNWYFGPGVINQRGRSAYENTGYTVDRWKLSNDGNTVELTDGGIKAYSTQEGTGANIIQYIENAGWLSGRTVTLSMLRTEGDSTQFFGLLRVQFADGSKVYPPTATRDEHDLLNARTFNVPEGDIDKVEIWLRCSDARSEAVGAYSTLLAAKLELGDQQTLAQKNDAGEWELIDPLPNQATELLKCQRYQQVMQLASGAYGFTTETNIARVFIPLAVTMRAKPTLNAGTTVFDSLREATINGAPIRTTTTNRTIQDNTANTASPQVSVNFTFQEPHGFKIGVPVVGYLTGRLILDANL